jgi:hypothetical protein
MQKTTEEILQNIRHMQIQEIWELFLMPRPVTEKEIRAMERFLPKILNDREKTTYYIGRSIQARCERHISPLI